MGKVEKVAFTFIVTFLSGCSVGKDSATTPDSDIGSVDSQSRLTIALSGNTKYRADETVTLYTLGGDLASDATVTSRHNTARVRHHQ